MQSIWVQHFSRYESVRTAYELAEEHGLKHPDAPISNHTVCTMEKGKIFRTVAHLTPSFIFARNNRRADKYHGGTMEYLRVCFKTANKQPWDNGLFAGNLSMTYYSAYGIGDLEKSKREQAEPALRSRRWPDAGMTTTAPALGLNTRAPIRIDPPIEPRWHPHFGPKPRAA